MLYCPTWEAICKIQRTKLYYKVDEFCKKYNLGPYGVLVNFSSTVIKNVYTNKLLQVHDGKALQKLFFLKALHKLATNVISDGINKQDEQYPFR